MTQEEAIGEVVSIIVVRGEKGLEKAAERLRALIAAAKEEGAREGRVAGLEEASGLVQNVMNRNNCINLDLRLLTEARDWIDRRVALCSGPSA